jgi:hypothetical protein
VGRLRMWVLQITVFTLMNGTDEFEFAF